MRGLLDGITAIPAIMAEQGCSREEAERLWISAMKAEAENARPTMHFTQDPIDIAERVALQLGVDVEEALDQMMACDHQAVLQFCVGNRMPKIMVN